MASCNTACNVQAKEWSFGKTDRDFLARRPGPGAGEAGPRDGQGAALAPLPGGGGSRGHARRQVRLRHFNRAAGESLERDVSPQRMVYYRDNWYLDGWCHLRDGLRSFSVDAIERVAILQSTAIDVPAAEMERELAAGYGIFSGSRVRWAVLRFTAERSRWVAAEEWHPEQRARFDSDGSYLLEVPYSDPRELMMDILKHGADVEVEAPPDLRGLLRAALADAIDRYADDTRGSPGSSCEPAGE